MDHAGLPGGSGGAHKVVAGVSAFSGRCAGSTPAGTVTLAASESGAEGNCHRSQDRTSDRHLFARWGRHVQVHPRHLGPPPGGDATASSSAQCTAGHAAYDLIRNSPDTDRSLFPTARSQDERRDWRVTASVYLQRARRCVGIALVEGEACTGEVEEDMRW